MKKPAWRIPFIATANHSRENEVEFTGPPAAAAISGQISAKIE
jgi:hypothetical protein